jgi:hypothetical protein
LARAASAAHWVVALESPLGHRDHRRGRRDGPPGDLPASGLYCRGERRRRGQQDLIEHRHPSQFEPHLAEVYRVLAPGTLSPPHAQQSARPHPAYLREYRLRELRQTAQACGFQSRWICLNLSRVGWTGTAPAWLSPAVETWESLWGALGNLGLRRLAGRCYTAAIPDVDVDLVKPERGCGSST